MSSEKQWFTEAELPMGIGGVRLSFEVKETLFDERSEWGHVQVLDTVFHGRMLVIDGIIQVTESDEFIYHEMMFILPAIQHNGPKDILVCGGGDGGILKQSLRLKDLQTVTQVEINAVVSNVSQKYLPSVSDGAFVNPKVTLHYQDAYEYIRDTDRTYDLIVLDLTDPVPDGPAARLFSEKFFQMVKSRLNAGGIVSLQCGSLLFQPSEIAEQVLSMQNLFAHVRFHNAVEPSYQFTSFGFILASDDPLSVLAQDKFKQRLSRLSGENKFLNYEMYRASQALPPYLKATIFGGESYDKSA